MWGATLDLVFDVVAEHLLLGTGGFVLWALQLGRIPREEQMERTLPNLVAGLLVWGAVLAGAARWLF